MFVNAEAFVIVEAVAGDLRLATIHSAVDKPALMDNLLDIFFITTVMWFHRVRQSVRQKPGCFSSGVARSVQLAVLRLVYLANRSALQTIQRLAAIAIVDAAGARVMKSYWSTSVSGVNGMRGIIV